MEQKIQHLLIEYMIKENYTDGSLPTIGIRIRAENISIRDFKDCLKVIKSLKIQLMQIDSFREINVFNLSNIMGVPPFVCRLLVNDI